MSTESPGARLKKIRMEKGLSLEDVHKKTKIHLNILKSIEEDSLSGLSSIYTKGFLKIYCNLLGVDPKDYVLGSEQPQPKVSQPKAPQPKASAPVVKEPAVVKESAPFRKSEPLSPSPFKKINIMKIVKGLVVLAFIIIGFYALSGLGKLIFRKRAAHPKTIKPAVVEPVRKSAKARENKAHSSPIKPEVSAPAVTSAPKTKSISSGIRLSMRAKEDSWVHLSVDGKVVFHSILKKGNFETWSAKNKIEFSLGNAAGIELELNDRVIPPLGRRGQAVKNVLVTKEEGLVVGR